MDDWYYIRRIKRIVGVLDLKTRIAELPLSMITMMVLMCVFDILMFVVGPRK
jgi:hypothetical protein